MVPILICFPFVSSGTPGYTCFVPNHRMLTFISFILIVLMLPIIILNSFDNSDLNLGFILLILFVCGTALFIIVGVIGAKKLNSKLLSLSFWVWCFTWVGFLAICIYSVWNDKTLQSTSINGRCPMTLWMFDWCSKTICVHRKTYENKSPELDFFNTYHRSQRNITFINKPLEETNFSIEISPSKPNVGMVNEIDKRLGEEVMKESQNLYNRLQRDKRTIIKMGITNKYPSGPEYRATVAYYLGIFFMMFQTIVLYTLYGVVIRDINKQLTWPPPIVFIARQPEDGDEKAAHTPTATNK